MSTVLQLLCFREFCKTGQLDWDKHLTLMMFNQCIWDIYAGECLNRKKPHPNWEQHHRSTLTCKIQLMRNIETLPSDFNAHHSYRHVLHIEPSSQFIAFYTSKWQQRAFPFPETLLAQYLRVQRERHRASGSMVAPNLSVEIHHVFRSVSTANQKQSNSKLSNGEHHGEQADPESHTHIHTHANIYTLFKRP